MDLIIIIQRLHVLQLNTGSEGCLRVQNEVALHQFMFAYRQVNYE